ncbi:DUF637 domain-containing protein [Aeromonas dhakensis]|uniref:DUF637 domain-containing protein n=2 Tax=Aeromonas dhakensis TaxID=196024 RepID=UPI0009E27961|nr:DUF637 domain-containing protein [Aeromonas dhakensis]
MSAGIDSTINGSHFADAFKASLLSNIQGEVGKATANWIGDQGIKFDAANSPLAEAGKIAAHGVASGAMSELAGDWSLGAFSSNEEYQVALNKVLGGLAAVAVTGDENDFYTGADRAETVHRYNAMAHTLAALTARDPEQFAKLMEAKRNQYKTCGESAECKKMMIAGLGLVGLPLLPSELLAVGGIGGGAKFGFELWNNKGDLSKVDVGEVVFSTYLSAGTVGWSFWPTVAVNSAGGAYTSHLKGEDPLVGGFASSLGAGTGYWTGK